MPTIYWQKKVKHGHRWVVAETDTGWRGNTYTIFLVPQTVTVDGLMAQLKKDNLPKEFPTIIANSWAIPLIFQSNGPEPDWVIDVGQPYQFLPEWQVHTSEDQGLKLQCSLQFRPAVKQSVALLPKAVQKWEQLLDQTMGTGEHDGSLNSTARMRITVEQMWANAALRPWVTDTPYNTLDEVNDGLEAWARTGPTHRTVYQAIHRQYPLAQKSPAAYYRSAFNRSPQEANAQATYMLGIALRSHYTFHSESRGDDQGRLSLNPWRGVQKVVHSPKSNTR